MGLVHAQEAWITINKDCLTNWWCKLDIYKTLQLREDTAGQNHAQYFIQDLFLWATFFVGTLAAIGLIISWVMMVFWWASESSYERWKKWMKYSIIGIILVILSYTIIRMVQFIAQGQR